jgi:hypothetical protein
MSCRIGSNVKVEQGAVGRQPLRSFEEANISLSKISTECIILLYNIYFMYMIVHLCIGVWWNLVALYIPLTKIPCLPYDGLER